MSLEDGVHFPESEQVFLGEEPGLAPCRVEDGTGVALMGGGDLLLMAKVESVVQTSAN